MKKSFTLLALIAVICFSIPAFAQNLNFERKSHVYLGIDIKVATLFSGTSIRSIFGIKLGYNQKIGTDIFAGPQAEALFIRSPMNKGARISLFAGPATEIEFKNVNQISQVPSSFSFSGRMSWVFPINPMSSDHTFGDCFSMGASIINDDFLGFNKTALGINLDFQRYDLGFYNGTTRMLNINTSSVTSL